MKVISFVSGKGGTGKTSIVGGVASCLAAMSNKTLCIDMDIGLRNLDIVIGLSESAVLDFYDVISNNATLENALVPHPDILNLWLLAAPTVPVSPSPAADQIKSLINRLDDFDYVLIDGPAGLGEGFRLAACAADMAVVVSTPEAVSLRDAKCTVDALEELGVEEIRLIVNRVRSKLVRNNDEHNIDDSMDRTGLRLLGVVPEDENVIICSNHGEPIIMHRQKGAALAYYNIAGRITGKSVPVLKI